MFTKAISLTVNLKTRGVYNQRTRKVTIEGYRLSNNRGISLGKYEAYLTEDNNDFRLGTWSNGGKWEAKW
jgi:hypothetical protein